MIELEYVRVSEICDLYRAVLEDNASLSVLQSENGKYLIMASYPGNIEFYFTLAPVYEYSGGANRGSAIAIMKNKRAKLKAQWSIANIVPARPIKIRGKK